MAAAMGDRATKGSSSEAWQPGGARSGLLGAAACSRARQDRDGRLQVPERGGERAGEGVVGEVERGELECVAELERDGAREVRS